VACLGLVLSLSLRQRILDDLLSVHFLDLARLGFDPLAPSVLAAGVVRRVWVLIESPAVGADTVPGNDSRPFLVVLLLCSAQCAGLGGGAGKSLRLLYCGPVFRLGGVQVGTHRGSLKG